MCFGRPTTSAAIPASLKICCTRCVASTMKSWRSIRFSSSSRATSLYVVGLEKAERQIFKLPLQLPDAKPIGQRRVKPHRFARDRLRPGCFAGRVVAQRLQTRGRAAAGRFADRWPSPATCGATLLPDRRHRASCSAASLCLRVSSDSFISWRRSVTSCATPAPKRARSHSSGSRRTSCTPNRQAAHSKSASFRSGATISAVPRACARNGSPVASVLSWYSGSTSANVRSRSSAAGVSSVGCAICMTARISGSHGTIAAQSRDADAAKSLDAIAVGGDS